MSPPRRVTAAMVRRIALGLPEAFESSHFDRPDFRIRNKIFATLREDDRTVVVKSTPANVDAIVRADAETFWNEWHGRWLGVRLDQVRVSVLRDLLEDAWALVAPKRLSSSFRESPPRS
jgi:hypothetical protein